MSWQCFQLTYELLSPLHIGYHKVGNLQRTRYYVPGRNLWAALTEALTRRGFSISGVATGDYVKIGEWVQQHCAFSYFYILENEQLLAPAYANGGLRYGEYSVAEFERRYLDSHVTTALQASTTSAESGSLHEVEFISPYPMDANSFGQRTRLRGKVFLDEEAQKHLEKIEQAMENIRLGGERRYGFGQLHKVSLREDATILNGYTFYSDRCRPSLSIPAGKPLLAHAVARNLRAQGQIEPLIGRETEKSDRSGAKLTEVLVCWAPGSVLMADATLQITDKGHWTE